MSTYLIHSTYHRQLQPAELGAALEQGHGLLLVDADGAPRFIENPLGMARKPKDELRKLWADACAEGRVYLAWANRWSANDELPALPVTIEPEAQGPQPEAATEALANA